MQMARPPLIVAGTKSRTVGQVAPAVQRSLRLGDAEASIVFDGDRLARAIDQFGWRYNRDKARFPERLGAYVKTNAPISASLSSALPQTTRAAFIVQFHTLRLVVDQTTRRYSIRAFDRTGQPTADFTDLGTFARLDEHRRVVPTETNPRIAFVSSRSLPSNILGTAAMRVVVRAGQPVPLDTPLAYQDATYEYTFASAAEQSLATALASAGPLTRYSEILPLIVATPSFQFRRDEAISAAWTEGNQNYLGQFAVALADAVLWTNAGTDQTTLDQGLARVLRGILCDAIPSYASVSPTRLFVPGIPTQPLVHRRFATFAALTLLATPFNLLPTETSLADVLHFLPPYISIAASEHLPADGLLAALFQTTIPNLSGIRDGANAQSLTQPPARTPTPVIEAPSVSPTAQPAYRFTLSEEYPLNDEDVVVVATDPPTFRVRRRAPSSDVRYTAHREPPHPDESGNRFGWEREAGIVDGHAVWVDRSPLVPGREYTYVFSAHQHGPFNHRSRPACLTLTPSQGSTTQDGPRVRRYRLYNPETRAAAAQDCVFRTLATRPADITQPAVSQTTSDPPLPVVHWRGGTLADAVTIRYRSNDTPQAHATTAEEQTQQRAVLAVAPGTVVSDIAIEARNATGAAPIVSVPGRYPVPPRIPVNITVGAHLPHVSLSWIPSAGASSYTVQRRSGDGAWIEIATRIAEARVTDRTAEWQHIYTYRVRSNSAANAASAWSTEATVQTAPPPPQPVEQGTLVTTPVYQEGVLVLRWAPAIGAAWYRILIEPREGEPRSVRVDTPELQLPLRDAVQPGSWTMLRVIAMNSSGAAERDAASKVVAPPTALAVVVAPGPLLPRGSEPAPADNSRATVDMVLRRAAHALGLAAAGADLRQLLDQNQRRFDTTAEWLQPYLRAARVLTRDAQRYVAPTGVVNLTWDPIPDVGTYRVLRRILPSDTFVEAQRVVGSGFTDTAPPDTVVQYRVQPVGPGLLGLHGTTPPVYSVPQVPQGIRVVPTPDRVMVTWQATGVPYMLDVAAAGSVRTAYAALGEVGLEHPIYSGGETPVAVQPLATPAKVNAFLGEFGRWWGTYPELAIAVLHAYFGDSWWRGFLQVEPPEYRSTTVPVPEPPSELQIVHDPEMGTSLVWRPGRFAVRYRVVWDQQPATLDTDTTLNYAVLPPATPPGATITVTPYNSIGDPGPPAHLVVPSTLPAMPPAMLVPPPAPPEPIPLPDTATRMVPHDEQPAAASSGGGNTALAIGLLAVGGLLLAGGFLNSHRNE